jgi:sugar transferase (PEP-CTERM system associated)
MWLHGRRSTAPAAAEGDQEGFVVKVFGHHVPLLGCVEFLADLLLCFVAVLLAASSLGPAAQDVPNGQRALTETLLFATGFAVVMSLMYAFVGLYRPRPIRVPAMLRRTLFALGAGGYLTYLVLRSVADPGYVEQLVSASVVYLLVGIVVVRSAIHVLMRASTPQRVLIVGTGDEADAVAEDLKTLNRGKHHLVGFFSTAEGSAGGASAVSAAPVFPRDASIEELVARHRVQEIIVAVREQRGGVVPMQQLLACRIRGVRVFNLAAFYERTRSEVPLDSLKASWLVYGQGFVQGRARQTAKRIFDIVSSSSLLLVSAPVMLLTMLAIKLDSRGPVFYRQQRVGLGGRLFMCLKFRSMQIDAEGDGVARWAVKDDPRITRVGSFIRKMRIDELPQLISVLRGEMSLVGPRPERPSFVEELDREIPFYGVRHSVKPGVTGWAQVRYTYGASVEDARKKHQLDLYYVKNNNLFLDMLVLIETVSVVLFREGQ